MKSGLIIILLFLVWSCPSRGTWIEIARIASTLWGCCCRAPRGARGLKLVIMELGSVLENVVPLAGHVD